MFILMLLSIIPSVRIIFSIYLRNNAHDHNLRKMHDWSSLKVDCEFLTFLSSENFSIFMFWQNTLT
jgi:hypothetical protein